MHLKNPFQAYLCSVQHPKDVHFLSLKANRWQMFPVQPWRLFFLGGAHRGVPAAAVTGHANWSLLLTVARTFFLVLGRRCEVALRLSWERTAWGQTTEQARKCRCHLCPPPLPLPCHSTPPQPCRCFRCIILQPKVKSLWGSHPLQDTKMADQCANMCLLGWVEQQVPTSFQVPRENEPVQDPVWPFRGDEIFPEIIHSFNKYLEHR